MKTAPNEESGRPAAVEGAEASCEIVSFRLAEQDFCVDIMDIREIRGWTPPTPLPRAPDYVLGLINLRGAVLPIIDLAKRLGLATSDVSPRDVIIVAMIDGQVIGLVVDAVSDILTARARDIQPAPAVGSESGPGYLQGIIAIDDRMLRLLDLRRVIPPKRGEAA